MEGHNTIKEKTDGMAKQRKTKKCRGNFGKLIEWQNREKLKNTGVVSGGHCSVNSNPPPLRLIYTDLRDLDMVVDKWL